MTVSLLCRSRVLAGVFLVAGCRTTDAGESSSNKTIYEGDDRKSYAALSAPLRSVARGVAALTYEGDVIASGGAYSIVRNRAYQFIQADFGRRELCPDVPFRLEPVVGSCTGFLVSPELMLTAAHCLEETPCDATSVVFDFYIAEESGWNVHTPVTSELGYLKGDGADVAECVEVVGRDEEADIAVLRLDRSYPDRVLSLSTGGAETGDVVHLLGHPRGLPLKAVMSASVTSADANTTVFRADTMAGNSGGPALAADSLAVVGLLVRGGVDYVLRTDGKCLLEFYCPADGEGCKGETMISSPRLRALLDKVTSGSPTQ